MQFGQTPPLVLLDCSKLQLGRGRLDGSVAAFRRRLEIFREMSLPMLKKMDNDNRLTVVSLFFNSSSHKCRKIQFAYDKDDYKFI